MQRVLPERSWLPIQPGSAVWDSFFRIKAIDLQHPYLRPAACSSSGSSRTTTRTKRLMVIANYNNDIGDYWEWSDTGSSRST